MYQNVCIPFVTMCFPFFSKDEVSGFDEGREEIIDPGTAKDLNENVKGETKKISGERILLRNKFVKKNNCREDWRVLL